MTNSDTAKITPQSLIEPTVDQPARYCIQVVGCLDQHWSDRLGGLTITSSSRAGSKDITTLSGVLIDQAALFGVLKALYDMRMPLLFVECLGTIERRNL
jgi:hypothetical protein